MSTNKIDATKLSDADYQKLKRELINASHRARVDRQTADALARVLARVAKHTPSPK